MLHVHASAIGVGIELALVRSAPLFGLLAALMIAVATGWLGGRDAGIPAAAASSFAYAYAHLVDRSGSLASSTTVRAFVGFMVATIVAATLTAWWRSKLAASTNRARTAKNSSRER